MKINYITLKNFRSYYDASFEFEAGVNMVVGRNGTGKTNLLEAVYVAMRGVSFRVPDKDLLRGGADWFRVDAGFDGQHRSLRYQKLPTANKRVVIGDGAKQRFTRAQRLPVVLFEPEMLRSLSGSPARRRRLLDELVSQWFPEGAALLKRYERVLLQRNKILKNAWDTPSDKLEDQLFAWDVSFAELAAAIEHCRARAAETLNLALSDSYSAIAQKSYTVEVAYDGTGTAEQQHILAQLRRCRRLDAARGYTTTGPHRGDIRLRLGGQPISTMASRGEQRSLVLAIKQVEAAELAGIHNTAPVLLLDDITGELDPLRVKSLLKRVAPYQTIATAAHHSPLLRRAASRHIEL